LYAHHHYALGAIIDGRAVAQRIRDHLKQDIDRIKSTDATFAPHLAIIQVGQVS
jgi:5,10-methylene-tetrahydrofolate dehydrogenase/methenyl tetrahydrofolate cyclohydrolase